MLKIKDRMSYQGVLVDITYAPITSTFIASFDLSDATQIVEADTLERLNSQVFQVIERELHAPS